MTLNSQWSCRFSLTYNPLAPLFPITSWLSFPISCINSVFSVFQNLSSNFWFRNPLRSWFNVLLFLIGLCHYLFFFLHLFTGPFVHWFLLFPSAIVQFMTFLQLIKDVDDSRTRQVLGQDSSLFYVLHTFRILKYRLFWSVKERFDHSGCRMDL